MATTVLSSSKTALLSSSFTGQKLKSTTTAPATLVVSCGRYRASSLKPSAQSRSGERHVFSARPSSKPITRGGVTRVIPTTIANEQQISEGQLTKTTVELPQLSLQKGPLKDILSPLGLERLQSIPGILNGKRKSTALLYYDSRVVSNKASSHTAVIFGHGFSQPPENYESTLNRLASEGWIVIAPTTFLPVKEMLLGEVEGAGKAAKAPTKLQTALNVDLLRAAQYLFSEEFASTAKIGKVMLCGHSMGSGCSLVVASYLKSSILASVAVMAPAVKGLLQSPVNQSLHMDGRRANYEEAKRFFADQYPTSPLTMIAGNQDMIATKEETSMLFVAALKAEEDKKLDKVRMYAVDGAHIGFEDRLNADITENLALVDKIIFPVLNFLVYQLDAINFIIKDTKLQKRLSQELIVAVFKNALNGTPVNSSDKVKDVAAELGISVADGQNLLTKVKDRNSLDNISKAMLENIDALADGYGKDVNALPGTIAVLSYALGHSLTFLTTISIAAEHPSWYLAILGLLAGGLVYENSVLAAGRSFGYLEDGEFFPAERGKVLEKLNEPRFIMHSLAPLLIFPALDIASRAGVGWASSAFVTGALTTVTVVTVALSFLRQIFLLDLRPKYSAGLLHYTYDDPGLDFTRIVPAAVASLIIVVLAFFSFQKSAMLLPFLLGSGISLGLQAVPSEKPPNPASLKTQIITGNLGEVFLLGSLAYAESIMRTQGL